MRAIGLAAMFALAACTTGTPSSSPAQSSPTPSPSPVAECRLPVVWNDASTQHHAFLSFPSGDIAEVDVSNGDVYDARYQRWVQGPLDLVSPDGSQYTYWSLSGNPPTPYQVHVVDVVSGVDRVIYEGATSYWPIAFADRIYAMHAINPKQNSFEGLFRLDPAGGTPVRLPGSDLLPNARWTLVTDGSAWGFDWQPGSQQILYRVEQLDLATGTVTDWLHEAPNLQLSPIGLDAKHRPYLSDFYELRRLDAPNVEEQLLIPPLVSGRVSLNIFVADAHGEWMGSWGGLWHHSDPDGARRFTVSTDQDMVVPAGPCQ